MPKYIDVDLANLFIEEHSSRYGITVANKCNFKEILGMVPESKVAPVVHARWVIGDGDDAFDIKCPVCGFSDVFDTCGISLVKCIAKTIHYCQNCGAKMDSED